MAKKNTSNNPLFREIRELEQRALQAGIFEHYKIKTSEAMRKEAWECYLISRKKWLLGLISDHELKAGGRKMSGYPIHIITSYRAGKISRQQFTKQFSDWQKSRGINFDCNGTADRLGVHVEYRGTTATIRDGVLHFFTGSYIDPKTNCRRYIRSTAKSVFDFCRKIDFARNDGVAKWN